MDIYKSGFKYTYKDAPKMTYLKTCIFLKQVYAFLLPFSTLHKNFLLSACKYLV